MNDLDRLAEALGILPSYYDVWGQEQFISGETKAALAAAMGWPADNEATISASLEALTADTWRRGLAPVLVVNQGAPIIITLALPAAKTGIITWQVTEESGYLHSGTLDLSVLAHTEQQDVSGVSYIRRQIDLSMALPEGYHDLQVILDHGTHFVGKLIITPTHCLTPAEIAPGCRFWGFAAQLYGVSSATSWGIGDFSDLGRLASNAAALGADMIGLNPLHALFTADPGHYSPYAPSSRAFLNITMIAVPAIPELAECPAALAMLQEPAFKERLSAVQEAELVDYPGIAALKLPILELLYDSFRTHHLSNHTERGKAYQAFMERGGKALKDFALFEALHEYLWRQQEVGWLWQEWPACWRNPASPEVAAFAAAHAVRLGFFMYLQFLAETQLADAKNAAKTAGMVIGFYQDLAVATHLGGAAAWAHQETVISGATVGAPPDLLAPKGQNWGLAPLSPWGLRTCAYAPFIDALRASMRHAGAIRIDHVMGLQRLYWIPAGLGGHQGAYVSYPLYDMLGIIALESRRQRCMVIGEDLGTVPEGFRPTLAKAGVLSYRVLYFERDLEDGFLAPGSYPAQALVTPSTHDLPTLAGFWTSHELAWRHRTGLYRDEDTYHRENHHRAHERWKLCQALAAEGLLPDGVGPESPMSAELMQAIYCYLSRSPGALLMVQLEDTVLSFEQANLPGTTNEHPNWRRRLVPDLDMLFELPQLRSLAGQLSAERGHAIYNAAE